MNPLRQAPRFAVSSRSSPLLAVDAFARAATGVAIDGVDLDLAGPAMRRRFVMADRSPDLTNVVSVWLSPTPTSIDRVNWTDWHPHSGLVVIDEEKGKTPNSRSQLQMAIRMRERVPDTARVALAVRPRNPDGGRAHLARLSFLRCLAEEWDLDLALDLRGTTHQQKVWRRLAAIPRGQVSTYGDIAQAIGSSPRAVGQACGANPIPVIIPCHRVISKHGAGGFMHQSGGDALSIKHWLLRHERCAI